MNWDQIEGNWKRIKGKVLAEWGELTDDDLDVIDGRRQQLAGKLQERYGLVKEDAEAQVTHWVRQVSDAWFHTEAPKDGIAPSPKAANARPSDAA